MTDWINIPNNEIAVDADVDALTMTKFKERDDFLNEVMNGTNAVKIVAQAIETQAAASGDGLTVANFNYVTATGSTNIGTSLGVGFLDTGVPASVAKVALFAVHPTPASGTGQFDFTLGANMGFGAGNWQIRYDRTIDSTTTYTLNWRIVGIAVS